ncbi:hypothetical protein G7074_22690 [Pedobacter sp. HDW13]|uniref:hypothetical protein n=1 Tax=unclassified Pedobacter TaxID=2628915 RepID=UPI000F5AED14|nr:MULTISPECIES: hypothetical protein [unclassified Pedobacter]QIL41825.1 hypothetical protein G7074_22690 [Pedobacter sp. HDW13]RQO73395.1 hypothetical protein DBR40_13670 [Pedobacter sp. KBW01]
MKTINALTLLLSLFIFQGVYAQSQVYGGTGIRYSVGIETGLATGYLAKKYEAPLGVSAQAEFPITEGILYASVNTGFNNIFVSGTYSRLVDDLHLVPIKTGLKYFYRSNLYIQSEIGVSFLLNKTNCVEGKKAAFLYAPQFGMIFYLHNNNYIDAGLRWESNGKYYKCDHTNNFVGFRVAWGFSL